MINLDKLGELKLEQISPALSRKQWSLPLQYDAEYLGGFYENPVTGKGGPVGIGLNFGAKTGDTLPVTLELNCAKGVLLPGARYYTYEFHKPAARWANALCRRLGLPAVMGETAANPYETWGAAFPKDACRLFRTDKGFQLVIEGEGRLLEVSVADLPPLPGPRYVSAELFDLKRVAKNCPKREQAEILKLLRKPGERLRGRTFLDAADLVPSPSSRHWTWRFPVGNPLGDFQLELQAGESPGRLDPGLLAAAMDLLLSAERNDDAIADLVYGDYRRCETQRPEALTSAYVPPALKRKAMRDYLRDRKLIVVREGKNFAAIARVLPQWRGDEHLTLNFQKGRIASVNGKAFKLKDRVLWCAGDKKSKPDPTRTVSPEFEAMANVLRLVPVQIEKTSAPSPMRSSLKRLLATAEAAGFVHLGWLEVTMPLPLTIAAFADADGGVNLSVATGMLLDKEVVDLVSHLDDNRKVTTTTLEFVMPQPARGIFKYSHPKANIPQLLRKHNEHIRELKGNIATRVRTLAEFEQAIRDFLSQENPR